MKKRTAFRLLFSPYNLPPLSIVFLTNPRQGKGNHLPSFSEISRLIPYNNNSSGVCGLTRQDTMNSHGHTLRSYARAGRRRKLLLDVDLNVPPPESQEQEALGFPLAQTGQVHQPGIHLALGGLGERPNVPVTEEASRAAALINVEDLDDDVVISSPRAFAQAKNNSRRAQGRSSFYVDIEAEEEMILTNQRNKRRRAAMEAAMNQPVINCEQYVNLEGSTSKGGSSQQVAQPTAPPPPPPPKEPTFSCPVCMGPLVEEMTTKCGHIFCKACIKASIAAQAKCPTCRRKVTNKDIIRVYLPTTN